MLLPVGGLTVRVPAQPLASQVKGALQFPAKSDKTCPVVPASAVSVQATGVLEMT
jgi:hypothetical protein